MTKPSPSPSRRVPEGSGWVTDGFPTTYAQAKLLEKALSGFDSDAMVQVNKAGTTDSPGPIRSSLLAPDPNPPAEKPKPRSGIDVVIHLELPDELCLKRSAGRTCECHWCLVSVTWCLVSVMWCLVSVTWCLVSVSGVL